MPTVWSTATVAVHMTAAASSPTHFVSIPEIKPNALIVSIAIASITNAAGGSNPAFAKKATDPGKLANLNAM